MKGDPFSAMFYRLCCRVPLTVRRVVRTGEVRVTCPKCRWQMADKRALRLQDRWNADVERRRPPKEVEDEV